MLAFERPTRSHPARSSFVFVPEIDTALGEVVRRHLQRDLVTGQDTNAVLPHFSRCVGGDLDPVTQRYTELGIA